MGDTKKIPTRKAPKKSVSSDQDSLSVSDLMDWVSRLLDANRDLQEANARLSELLVERLLSSSGGAPFSPGAPLSPSPAFPEGSRDPEKLDWKMSTQPHSQQTTGGVEFDPSQFDEEYAQAVNFQQSLGGVHYSADTLGSGPPGGWPKGYPPTNPNPPSPPQEASTTE